MNENNVKMVISILRRSSHLDVFTMHEPYYCDQLHDLYCLPVSNMAELVARGDQTSLSMLIGLSPEFQEIGGLIDRMCKLFYVTKDRPDNEGLIEDDVLSRMLRIRKGTASAFFEINGSFRPTDLALFPEKKGTYEQVTAIELADKLEQMLKMGEDNFILEHGLMETNHFNAPWCYDYA